MEQTQNTYNTSKTSFLGLVLRDPSLTKFDNGSSIYCYLIEEGAYAWIYLNQCDYSPTNFKSPYNGKPLHKIWISNYMLKRIQYKRSWCPEFFFPEYISYFQLQKKLLRRRLTKYLEQEKLEKKLASKPKTFTLKNILIFFGAPKIKNSDTCLGCRIDLLDNDKKKLVCDSCREFIEEDIKLSGVNSHAKYLPQGLMKDPLEIRFEDIGIKYKNRRYKWFESYKKGKVVKSKTKGSNPGIKVKIIDNSIPEKSKTKKKTRKTKKKSKVKVI